eukprot:4980424-Pyramimonas_sp.AAC.1
MAGEMTMLAEMKHVRMMLVAVVPPIRLARPVKRTGGKRVDDRHGQRPRSRTTPCAPPGGVEKTATPAVPWTT